MSPEEFQRLKEQEKAHLRKLKELKGQVRDATRQARLAQTLGDIAGAVEPNATYDEMMDKLTLETARNEARFEMAQESAQGSDASDEALEKAAEAEKHEAELAQQRARQLVEQMKSQMGGPSPTAPPASETPKTLGRTDAAETTPSAPPPAEKTLGRRL